MKLWAREAREILGAHAHEARRRVGCVGAWARGARALGTLIVNMCSPQA